MSVKSRARYEARAQVVAMGWVERNLPALSIDEIKALTPDQIEARYRRFRGTPVKPSAWRQ